MGTRWLLDASADDGDTVDSSRKSEVTRGVVLPLVVLVVIFALGIVTGEPAVFIAMMGAVPMMSAVFASSLFVALVALVTVTAGLVLAFVPGDEAVEDSLIPLVALVVLAAHRPDREPVPRGSGDERVRVPRAAQVRPVPAPDPG